MPSRLSSRATPERPEKDERKKAPAGLFSYVPGFFRTGFLRGAGRGTGRSCPFSADPRGIPEQSGIQAEAGERDDRVPQAAENAHGRIRPSFRKQSFQERIERKEENDASCDAKRGTGRAFRVFEADEALLEGGAEHETDEQPADRKKVLAAAEEEPGYDGQEKEPVKERTAADPFIEPRYEQYGDGADAPAGEHVGRIVRADRHAAEANEKGQQDR